MSNRLKEKVERKTNLPIICVGNIVVGGAGKTPVALKIGNMLIKAGYHSSGFEILFIFLATFPNFICITPFVFFN